MEARENSNLFYISVLNGLTTKITMDLEETKTKDEQMWHPHVYATPPKSPTPFSIDDILKRHQRGPQSGPGLGMTEVNYVSEWNKLLALWAMVGPSAVAHNSSPQCKILT